MTAVQPQQARRPVGRPTKYRPEMCAKAQEFARAGMTRADIAVQLGVSESHMYAWANKYPEFSQALNQERAIADTAVASALYLKATGQATKTVRKVITKEDGSKEVHETIETLGPDERAARYWLNNRAPKQWRDRIEVTGADGQALNISLSWLQGARNGRAGDVVDVPFREQSEGQQSAGPALAGPSGPSATDTESGD